MTYYPYNLELQEASGANNNFDKFKNGNFGLWYNKFIPLKSNNSPKASNNRGDESATIDYYKEIYNKSVDKTNVDNLLTDKHLIQLAFCKSIENNLELLTITAKTISPFVLGIGESHPHEISMTFDHNLGIPYIPASSIKGIVRLSHTLLIFLNEDGSVKNNFADKTYIDESITDIPDIFGGEKSVQKKDKNEEEEHKGQVVFLDAYPLKKPELKADIINPHYGDYYNDDKNNTPPADYLNPVPIKFLTVKEGTEFVFRALVPKKLKERVLNAYKKTLTEEGIGAKTAIGYGRFALTEGESDLILEKISKIEKQKKEKSEKRQQEERERKEKKRLEAMSPKERLEEEIVKEVQSRDGQRISTIVKKCLAESTSKEAIKFLREQLIKIDEWKPKGGNNKKKKMKKRNEEIEKMINQ